MNSILRIAAGEWRYWFRSYLAVGGILAFLLLVASSSWLTASRMAAETQARVNQQQDAEETFLEQPDRHPHRMVHYGHYVFRAPPPLAIFDPGLDSVTGQSLFLEGHRQNTPTFSESAASADLGGFSQVTPALIYQLFGVLVIILLGHGAIGRERESGTLVPLMSLGVASNRLLLGKALALVLFIVILLLPLAVISGRAVNAGEEWLAVFLLIAVYFVYLLLWVLIVLGFSACLRKRGTALVALTGLWFVVTLVLPSIAVNVATHSLQVPGKIEADLAMAADLRKIGDGHNANDPAFAALRASLLKKYGAEKIEDLPVNFRGLVAMESEQKITTLLNDYAEDRLAGEIRQQQLLEKFGWLSPPLAIAFVSRAIAGTDLIQYHRFQREAEAVRYAFVQGLNRAHAQVLSYQDDINRNKDDTAKQRARVSASHWQVLETYRFQRASLSVRLDAALLSLGVLGLWLLGAFSFLLWTGRRIKP